MSDSKKRLRILDPIEMLEDLDTSGSMSGRGTKQPAAKKRSGKPMFVLTDGASDMGDSKPNLPPGVRVISIGIGKPTEKPR